MPLLPRHVIQKSEHSSRKSSTNKRESLTERKQTESFKQVGTHWYYNDHDHHIIYNIRLHQYHSTCIIHNHLYQYIHLPIQLWDSAPRTKTMLILNTETPLMHWFGQGLSKRNRKMARIVPHSTLQVMRIIHKNWKNGRSHAQKLTNTDSLLTILYGFIDCALLLLEFRLSSHADTLAAGESGFDMSHLVGQCTVDTAHRTAVLSFTVEPPHSARAVQTHHFALPPWKTHAIANPMSNAFLRYAPTT